MREVLIVAIYGALQENLRLLDLVDKRGVPLKYTELVEEDCINIYKYFATLLGTLPTKTMNEIIDNYNKVIISLTDDYQLNNLLLAIKLSEKYLVEYGTYYEKEVTIPKIDRVIKEITKHIPKEQAIQSAQASRTVYDMLKGKKEVTLLDRSKKLLQWRNK